MEDFYAPWEWLPIELMPDGCQEVEVKTFEGKTEEMCSCDYWWLSTDKKSKYMSFRGN